MWDRYDPRSDDRDRGGSWDRSLGGRGGSSERDRNEHRDPRDVFTRDQPEISSASHHHLADHHVIARTGPARRHRQGPQAARTRGRSEATSLAR